MLPPAGDIAGDELGRPQWCNLPYRASAGVPARGRPQNQNRLPSSLTGSRGRKPRWSSIASPGRSRPPPPVEAPAPHSQAFEAIDRALHGDLAPLTFGLSPAVLERAYLDWLLHLAFPPGKQSRS